jgi:hypothetical protein
MARVAVMQNPDHPAWSAYLLTRSSNWRARASPAVLWAGLRRSCDLLKTRPPQRGRSHHRGSRHRDVFARQCNLTVTAKKN